MTLTPGKLDQVPDGEAEGAGPSVLKQLFRRQRWGQNELVCFFLGPVL
jgi:hypothetical protein